MRSSLFACLAGAMMLMTTLLGHAQNDPIKAKELEKKKTTEKVNGKTYYEWAKDLKSKDASVREQAISVLKAWGWMAQDETKEILKAIDQKDVSLKVNA